MSDISFYILTVLAGVGLTHIAVSGKIMDFLREWAKQEVQDWWEYLGIKQFAHSIITCYQCSGFWAGMLIGLSTKGYNGLGLFITFLFLTFLTEKVKIHPVIKVMVWSGMLFIDNHVLVAFLLAFSTSYVAMLSAEVSDFIVSNTSFMIGNNAETKNTGN